MPKIRHRLHPIRLWTLLQEPRSRTFLLLLAYSTLGAAGIGAFSSPPSTIQAEWGPVLTDVWATLLITGAAVALAAVPRGIWWAERIGITILAVGAAMYLSVIVILHVTSHGNRLPQAAFVAVTLVWLVIRWIDIRNAALDPTRGPNSYTPHIDRDDA